MSKKAQPAESTLFVRDKGIWRRFFAMLFKSRLPILWIAGYIAINMVIVKMGVSVTEYTSEMFAGNLSFEGIILPFIIYSGVNLITSFIATIISYLCRARIDRNLRRMVWAKITRLPLGYFDRNKPKELLTRITSDTAVISSLVMLTVIPFFTGLYNLYVMFSKVGSYDPALMWSLLLVVPFVLGSGFMMGKMRFGVNDTVNRKSAELARDVSEKMTNISLIKATAAEDKETEAGAFRMKDLYKATIKASWVGYLASPVATIVGALQLIMIVLVGRSFYQSGAITLTQWIAYLAFAQQVANTLQSYSGYWTSFKAAQGSTRRVTYIMEEENETAGTDVSAADMKGGFEVKNVSFSYGETPVLKNISLSIPEGKVTAFIGESGGGKTTMLNLLERFYEPQEGEITVGDTPLNTYNMRSYRSSIAYLTQESTMLSGTIRDNLLFGIDRKVDDGELDQACRAANALDFIQEFPESYDTDIGESGSRLSGGQKQRIAIARAMLKQPHYMFMDEATAAMDAKGKQEVWFALENMMANKTVVMVAHDYQTASHADYVVVFNHGQVEDAGTQEELFKRNKFFRQLMKSTDKEVE